MLRARRNNRGGAVSARSRIRRLGPFGPTAVTQLSANSAQPCPLLTATTLWPLFTDNMASHPQQSAHRGSWRNSYARRSANEGAGRRQPMASSQSAPALASRRNDPIPPSASTGRRNMNLIASVSRSSGLERGGDESVVLFDGPAYAVLTVSSLKDHAIQEEYRAFIQDKVSIFSSFLSESVTCFSRSTMHPKYGKLAERSTYLRMRPTAGPKVATIS